MDLQNLPPLLSLFCIEASGSLHQRFEGQPLARAEREEVVAAKDRHFVQVSHSTGLVREPT